MIILNSLSKFFFLCNFYVYLVFIQQISKSPTVDTDWVFIDVRTAATNSKKVIPGKTSGIVGSRILFTSQSKNFMIRWTTAVIKSKRISVRNFQLINKISVTITHQNFKHVLLSSTKKVTCHIQRGYFF